MKSTGLKRVKYLNLWIREDVALVGLLLLPAPWKLFILLLIMLMHPLIQFNICLIVMTLISVVTAAG